MAAGDILEVLVCAHNDTRGDQYRNVLHYKVTTTENGVSNEESLCTSFKAAYVANIQPKISSSVFFDQIIVQRVFPLPRTAGFYIGFGGAGAGGIAGDMLPGQCAAVIRKRTAFAGRAFRGRVFQFGIPESYQSNGSLSGASWAALVVAWDSLLTTNMAGVEDGVYTPVIWPKNGIDGSAKTITSSFGDNVVRTQRRRENGVGA